MRSLFPGQQIPSGAQRCSQHKEVQALFLRQGENWNLVLQLFFLSCRRG